MRAFATVAFSLSLGLSLPSTQACSRDAAPRSGAIAVTSDSSAARVRAQLIQVDDSLKALLSQLDGEGAGLARLDSARATVEIKIARSAEVNERLAKDAPTVYARLTSFVAEHKRLKAQLSAMNDTITKLRARVQRLEARNADLRAKVVSLTSQNEELRTTIAKLVGDSVQRSRKIAELDSSRSAILTKSSRAYVTIASRDSLSRLGIAGKTNFLRLGPAVLRRFDTRAFRLIDTRADTVFVVPVSPRRMHVLSTHPAGSFAMIDDGGTTRILVIDVDAFWAASRMLAVMTDQ